MPEHDNDSLERFFQKAAREPEIEFNENDWRKLEARLDSEAVSTPPARAKYWKTGVVVGTIMIISVATYFFVSNNDQDKPGTIADSSVTNIPKGKREGTVDTPGSPKQMESAPLQSNQLPSAEKTMAPEGNRNLRARESGGVTENLVKTKEFETKNPVDPNMLANLDEDKGGNLFLPERNEAQLTGTGENGVTQSARGDREGEKIAVPLLLQPDSAVLTENKKPVVEKPENKDEKSDTVVKSRVPSRWSVVLSFAPDFSSTGLNQYTSPGEAFGLAVQYHINNSFSISTGLMESKKKYWGYGDEYKPPKGYWKTYTNGVIPQKVSGVCRVMEIPLTLQYGAAKWNRSRLTVTGGMSSYLMLSESYRYTFETPNPGAKEGWSSNKTSSFLFSIATLSIGYERNIFRGVAAGIEPYIKIPMAGIGWSDINLYTVGASFTLRYRIQKKGYVPLPQAGPG